ncbi:lantibiotic dehydratase [Frankia tisae]|uniref:lantibiotic dehydratase n=1 Tax=Frankia tisae TaxID=2950104 RepID=UPI0021BFF02C|nr:lantibiotic dehydratase [Frankia tisae]
MIIAVFDGSDGTYGHRRVHAHLARQGETCGIELVRSLMRQAHLVACQPRPWRHSLTDAGPAGPIPDLVNRDFTASAPGVKMVGDISYIPTWQGWLYLVLRWQRRVTPFGLFAGVVPAAVGPAGAAIGGAHRVIVRPAAEWIAILARDLGRTPALRDRLIVAADSTAIVRDGRLILTRRAAIGARTPGAVHEASIRATESVRAAMDLAASPVSVTVLAAVLAERAH